MSLVHGIWFSILLTTQVRYVQMPPSRCRFGSSELGTLISDFANILYLRASSIEKNRDFFFALPNVLGMQVFINKVLPVLYRISLIYQRLRRQIWKLAQSFIFHFGVIYEFDFELLILFDFLSSNLICVHKRI